jgi:hypothetical protein
MIMRPATVVVPMFSATERKPVKASRGLMLKTSFHDHRWPASFQSITVSPSHR